MQMVLSTTLTLLFLTTILMLPANADNISHDDRTSRTILVGQTLHYNTLSENDAKRQLRIYCYAGKPESLLNFFETVELQFHIDNDDFTQYEGQTPAQVREHYDNDNSLFSVSLFAQKRQRLNLSPFEKKCIGMDTAQPYSVHLKRIIIDSRRFAQLVIGVLMFFSARRLSNNSLFYYMSGVLVGICASFLLLLILIAKLFPKRPMVYGMIIGGWTVAIYALKLFLDNLQTILITYRGYVLWYIVITGIISFLICYRFGPPRNRRSKNIIMWLLQFLAIFVIFFSSSYEPASMAVIIATLIVYYFPRSLLRKIYISFRRRFRKPRRLLTKEEYDKQAIEETNKSLNELRAYVNSPECRAWRVMHSLNNPNRFAYFANGGSHLEEEELEEHANTVNAEGSNDPLSAYRMNEDTDESETEMEPLQLTPSLNRNRSRQQQHNNTFAQHRVHSNFIQRRQNIYNNDNIAVHNNDDDDNDSEAEESSDADQENNNQVTDEEDDVVMLLTERNRY